MHSCITHCYIHGHIPHAWLTSETLCLFKGKGAWQDPDRWRPIAMSNSIYRLLMRWVYRTLYPLISPLLHPRQFGGRQGTSPAHATKTFLQDLGQLDNKVIILAFDAYHAFDSPPKALICQVLGRLGTPVRLLQLITQALKHGTTYIRGSQSPPFGTTHGVKQGCPLSFFLFVIVFDIPSAT